MINMTDPMIKLKNSFTNSTEQSFDMKIWKISQKENNNWDTFDSAVVFAETEKDARMTFPHSLNQGWDGKVGMRSSWCDAKYVTVEYLGVTDRDVPNKTVICASFNAG